MRWLRGSSWIVVTLLWGCGSQAAPSAGASSNPTQVPPATAAPNNPPAAISGAPSTASPVAGARATVPPVSAGSLSMPRTAAPVPDAGKPPAQVPDEEDAGVTRDAGAAMDAGATRDAGSPADQTTKDAGTPTDANRPPTSPVPGGTLSGPVSGGKGPFKNDKVDLQAHGYVEEEYFLEGSATSYVARGELGLDGKWTAAASGKAPYKTRLLVRRPANPDAFNGTLLVEWLNVTTGKDASVGFSFGWEELLRGGYAYVGVSVQQTGVDALKTDDAARYAGLVHPGDAYCYDIFSQAAAAVGWPGESKVLGGLRIARMIAYGESQSAMRMITYVNAIHSQAELFDGIIIHCRAGWGAPVGTESDGFLGNGKPVRVRADHNARILQFFTETEIFLPLGPAYGARQPDEERLRTWEVAGTAHADQRLLGSADTGCGVINAGPQHFVVKAAFRAMHRWLKEGVAPAHGTPISVTAAQNAIARDADGNALGGIRTPAVDVPIAMLSGEPSALNALNPLCLLYGQTRPFTPRRIEQLYPTHQDYVSKVSAAARAAREAGFLLEEEEASIVADAMSAAIPR